MAGGGLAGTALLMSLVGCGGSDNKNNTSGSSAPASSGSGAGGASAASGASGALGGTGSTGAAANKGLVSAPVDTTSQAKAGGALKHFATEIGRAHV